MSGWQTGFSLALPKSGEPVIDLDLGHKSFSQMAAVSNDHGTYDDPLEYYTSALCRDRPGKVKLSLYRRLVDGINRRVQGLRQGLAT